MVRSTAAAAAAVSTWHCVCVATVHLAISPPSENSANGSCAVILFHPKEIPWTQPPLFPTKTLNSPPPPPPSPPPPQSPHRSMNMILSQDRFVVHSTFKVPVKPSLLLIVCRIVDSLPNENSDQYSTTYFLHLRHLRMAGLRKWCHATKITAIFHPCSAKKDASQFVMASCSLELNTEAWSILTLTKEHYNVGVGTSWMAASESLTHWASSSSSCFCRVEVMHPVGVPRGRRIKIVSASATRQRVLDYRIITSKVIGYFVHWG